MRSKPTYQELEKENEILRKKLETGKSNEKFKSFFDNNKAIMLQINSATTQITKANEVAVNFYGYSENELLQKTVSDLNTLPPDKISTVIKEVVNNKSNFFEFQHKLSNGKIKDVEVYISPFNIDDEIHMIATIYDITERKKAEQNLKQYKEIVNSASEHMSFIDTNYVYQAVNNSYLKAHKKKREEVIGHTIADLLGNEVFDNMIKDKIDACFSGEIVKYETCFDFVGIGKRYMEVSYYPYFNEEIIISGVIVDSCDITDRKNMEEALQKSKIQLRQIVDLVPHCIFVKDETGKFEIVNKATADIFGTTVENIIGKSDYEFIATKEQIKSFRDDDIEVINSGKTKFIPEKPITDSENNIKYLQTTKVPFSLSDTNKPSLLGVAVDITERVQLEKTLKTSEERFRTVADYTYDWEYWIDPKGRMLYISPSCERITGYSTNEFMQNPKLLTSIVHISDADDWKNHKHYSFDNAGIETIEFRIITKSGKVRWIGHVCQTVYNEDGINIGIRGSNRDITERKLAELAFKDSEDRLSKTLMAANDGMWDWNLITNKVYFDSRYYEMAGYVANEFPYELEEFQKRIHPYDVENVMTQAQQHIDGNRFKTEFRLKKKLGIGFG